MKLGDIIDRIFELRKEKDELAAQVSDINVEIEELQYRATTMMQEEGIEKTSTENGSVSLKVEQYPNVKDLDALVNWAYQNGKPDILQRRISKSVFDEVFEATGEYPDGTDAYPKVSLNYRRK